MENVGLDKINADDVNGVDERKRRYIIPKRIVWKTENRGCGIENEEVLLVKTCEQVFLETGLACILHNQGEKAGILIDFGTELHGGAQVFIGQCGGRKTARIRARFGESVMEAMSEIGEKGSTNDHAVRDCIVEVSALGTTEFGNTGFRFVRIDLQDENGYIEIKAVRAMLYYMDLEYKGRFKCNDELLNKIWNTGAYTVHLNMQNFLWDGIKRDRLVWIGDMYPEVCTIQAVFGETKVVNKSLDFIRDITPLPNWMNTIPSYSMWWIVLHHELFMNNGDLTYLKEQQQYLICLLHQLEALVGDEGKLALENTFVDWSSPDNKQAENATLYALLLMAMRAGAAMCDALGEKAEAEKAIMTAVKIKNQQYHPNGNKQAAAMLSLAELANPILINHDVLAVGGAKNLSAFMGHFVLKARAKAGDFQGALDMIRQYWGGMLKMGATTFWEEFDVEWMTNAGRIDELVPNGKKDIHGDTGDHCYRGYRKSLCHGWASGPTQWLTEHVLGIKVVKPGCLSVCITPNLGDLCWAEGTYPTPFGIIKVRHDKRSDGSVRSSVEAPEGVKVLRDNL